jgi:hypothetical protein
LLLLSSDSLLCASSSSGSLAQCLDTHTTCHRCPCRF